MSAGRHSAPGGAPTAGVPRRAGRRNNPNAWMVTFTDLVALMLTFFVMIFAMSTVKTEKWQSLTDSLRQNLSSVLEQRPAAPTVSLDMPAREVTPGADLDYVEKLVRGQLDTVLPAEAVRIRHAADRLFVSLPSDLLFASGDDDLRQDAADAVFALGGVLENLPNRVGVAGHADPRKPARGAPSNWELSLRRARSVAAGLEDSGYAGAMNVRGYGASRFAELPRDLPPARRRALARRVDVVIHAAAREAR